MEWILYICILGAQGQCVQEHRLPQWNQGHCKDMLTVIRTPPNALAICREEKRK